MKLIASPVEQKASPWSFIWVMMLTGEYVGVLSQATWSNSDIGGGLKLATSMNGHAACDLNNGRRGEWKTLIHGQNGLDASSRPAI
jgi:hypothetical protein